MARVVCEAYNIKSDIEKHLVNSLKAKENPENERWNGLPEFYIRSLTSQWGEWPRRDVCIATQVLIMYVWQWALQNNKLIQICISEDLTMSLHGSQATRLKNKLKVTEWKVCGLKEEHYERPSRLFCLFGWAVCYQLMTIYLWFVFMKDHTRTIIISKRGLRGWVILWDIHRWTALGGKRHT